MLSAGTRAVDILAGTGGMPPTMEGAAFFFGRAEAPAHEAKGWGGACAAAVLGFTRRSSRSLRAFAAAALIPPLLAKQGNSRRRFVGSAWRGPWQRVAQLGLDTACSPRLVQLDGVVRHLPAVSRRGLKPHLHITARAAALQQLLSFAAQKRGNLKI